MIKVSEQGYQMHGNTLAIEFVVCSFKNNETLTVRNYTKTIQSNQLCMMMEDRLCPTKQNTAQINHNPINAASLSFFG